MNSNKSELENVLDVDRLTAAVDRVFQRRYRVYRTSIGEGGMGTVFRVETNDAFHMTRALKVLYKKDQKPGMNIYAEVNAVKGLDHPGIPQIIEVGEDEEAVYIIQELIEGESFRKIIEKNGAIDDETLILWMGDVADTLSYLHSKNIIHRDIKPTNIMVTAEGRIKLIDFGLAKEIEQVDAADNRVIGTRNYTPPERYEGLPADVRTDIYEFGTTFYYLSTGETPLEMSSDSRKHMFIMRRNLDKVKSPGIRSILSKCIDVNPDRRYQSFDEIRYRIQSIDEFNKQIIENERRHKSMKIATAVLLAAGLILVGVGLWRAVADHDKHFRDMLSDIDQLRNEGRYEEAKKKAEEAIEFDEGKNVAYQKKYEAESEIAGAAGDQEKERFSALAGSIKDDYKKNEELEKDPKIQYLLGNAYYRSGQNAKAEAPLEYAVEEKPKLEGYYLVQAVNYLDQGKMDDASLVIAKLNRKNNESTAALYIDGYANKEKNEYKKAEKNFNRVIREEKEDTDLRRKAVTELADMYLNEMNSPEKAVKVLQVGRKKASVRKNWRTTAMLADAYINMAANADKAGNAQQAAYCYGKALNALKKQKKLGDNSPTVDGNIYVCYMGMGRYDNAIAQADKIIETDAFKGNVRKARAVNARENMKQPPSARDYDGEYRDAYEKATGMAESQGLTGDSEYERMQREHEALVARRFVNW